MSSTGPTSTSSARASRRSTDAPTLADIEAGLIETRSQVHIASRCASAQSPITRATSSPGSRRPARAAEPVILNAGAYTHTSHRPAGRDRRDRSQGHRSPCVQRPCCARGLPPPLPHRPRRAQGVIAGFGAAVLRARLAERLLARARAQPDDAKMTSSEDDTPGEPHQTELVESAGRHRHQRLDLSESRVPARRPADPRRPARWRRRCTAGAAVPRCLATGRPCRSPPTMRRASTIPAPSSRRWSEPAYLRPAPETPRPSSRSAPP